MRNSRSYREEAWERLTSNFWPMFLVFLIYFVVAVVCEGIYELNDFGVILSLLIMPLSYGVYWTTLDFSRGLEISPKDIVEPYLSSVQFFRTLGASLLVYIFIFLWSLLLIIPGIIKAFSYALVPFILKDDENILVIDAITLSRKIMDGHKWRLFKLYLTFIGWILLILITFGIAACFVAPYIGTAQACFYNDVKKKYETDQVFYEPF